MIKRKPKDFAEAWEMFHSKARDFREKDREVKREQRRNTKYPKINLGKWGIKTK